MTPREQAEIDVAVIAADLQAARERLREAVKAEVRAMPTIDHSTDLATIRDVVSRVLGDEGTQSRPHEMIWGLQSSTHVSLVDTDASIALRPYHADRHEEAIYPVTGPAGVSLDTAIRRTLLWLADRDVFLPPRAP